MSGVCKTRDPHDLLALRKVHLEGVQGPACTATIAIVRRVNNSGGNFQKTELWQRNFKVKNEVKIERNRKMLRATDRGRDFRTFQREGRRLPFLET
jgi:hypothetical protein